MRWQVRWQVEGGRCSHLGPEEPLEHDGEFALRALGVLGPQDRRVQLARHLVQVQVSNGEIF